MPVSRQLAAALRHAVADVGLGYPDVSLVRRRQLIRGWESAQSPGSSFNDSFQRVSSTAIDLGERLLAEPTAAARPWRLELDTDVAIR